MLSQLNYRASAYLNDGVRAAATSVRRAFVLRSGAAVSDRRRLPGVVHHPRRASGSPSPQRPVSRASRRWPSARPAATRCSPSSRAALATDTAAGWEARLRPLGIPAAAVRTLPEALDGHAGGRRHGGRFPTGGQPDPGRRVSNPTTGRRRASTSTARSRSVVVVHRHRRRVGNALAGQHVARRRPRPRPARR